MRYQSTLRQIDTVTHLNAQTNKNAERYIGLVANTVYHFLICIGKRRTTRSVENPFGIRIRRGNALVSALRADPIFVSKTQTEFLRYSLYKIRTYFESNPDDTEY